MSLTLSSNDRFVAVNRASASERALPIGETGQHGPIMAQDLDDLASLFDLNEATLELQKGKTDSFHPVILQAVIDDLKLMAQMGEKRNPVSVEKLKEIEWAVFDFIEIAKAMIECEGSRWKSHYEELQASLKDLAELKISYKFPERGLVAKAVGLFLNPSDPTENFFLHLRAFQNRLSQIQISPKDDLGGKKRLEQAVQRRVEADAKGEMGMSERKKRVLNFFLTGMQLTQQAIQRPLDLDTVYQRSGAGRAMSVSKRAERGASFIGVTLHDKLDTIRKMSAPEFERYTRRFPETRAILEPFRSSSASVTGEEIFHASERFLNSNRLPLVLRPSEWWNAFISPPKNREAPYPQAERAAAHADTIVKEMSGKPVLKSLKLKGELLRKNLRESMRTAPSASSSIQDQREWAANFGQQCVAVEQLEQDLKHVMDEARPSLMLNERTLSEFGGKHAKLVEMGHLKEALELTELEIPHPRGISDEQIHSFLVRHAPKVFENWEKLKELHRDNASFSLENETVAQLLGEIDQAIENAFAKKEAYRELQLPLEMVEWMRGQAKKGHYLMVRSTGAEDSKQMANAGGNASRSYVPPTEEEVAAATGVVVRSYFGKTSLQNRLNGGVNPFEERLKLAVTTQELIGEPVGGAKSPSDIPVSFVLFTNEPLYIGGEKFRAMRLSATYGHGEGVVSQQGINTDTVIYLRSDAHPDQLYYIYSNQKKPERLAPMRRDGGEVGLEKIANPLSIQEVPSLNEKNLIDLYSYGVLMEAFYDSPTDIEGVVKNGKAYFVQARSVNRKPLLPTYLDSKGKDVVSEKLEGEVLVTGKASVVTIEKREEVLLAATLEEAERRLGRAGSRVKLVIVSHPEPENSHPVVNFSGLGLPCLMISDEPATRALLDKINPDHPLAVCMQRGSVNLWDRTKGDLADHIVDGFAVHPAKISLSLPVHSGLGAHVPPPPPKELQRSLRQIRDHEDPMRALGDIESHPDLQYLRAKRKTIQTAYQGKAIPQAIQIRLQVLEELDRKISRALAELGKVLEKTGGRLEQLFHVKVVETLLFGVSSNGLGHYSLLDVKSICNAIDRLKKYQDKISHPAHALDLLLDGEKANPEAFPYWKDFLIELEPLVESGTISKGEWRRFKQLISTLKETGSLPFWLTFFQTQSNSMTPFRTPKSIHLDRFRSFIGQISSNDEKTIDSLVFEQQSISTMRSQIDRFKDPKSFPDAWKELQAKAALFSSATWLEPVKVAAPIVQSIAYRTMESFVDLFDAAVKALKSSSQFPQEALQVKRFGEMLLDFYKVSRSWAESVVPDGKVPTHENWPVPRYFDQINQLLQEKYSAIQGNERTEFLPSREFSVAAAALGTRTEFSRHLPRSLEDMLTLLHQNCLVSVNALNQELLSSDQINQSLLPQALRETIERVERSGWRPVQRLGIEVTSKEIILKYNVPLRNHSGQLNIHYDPESGKMVLKAHFLGEARDRWSSIAEWVRGLEKAQYWVQDRPLSMSQEEIHFSIRITPENLEAVLRQYHSMAEYSMGTDFHLFVADLFASFPNGNMIWNFCKEIAGETCSSASRVYLERGHPPQKLIDAVMRESAHSEDQRTAHAIIKGLLRTRVGFELALDTVKEKLSSAKHEEQQLAYPFLMDLSDVVDPPPSNVDLETFTTLDAAREEVLSLVFEAGKGEFGLWLSENFGKRFF